MAVAAGPAAYPASAPAPAVRRIVAQARFDAGVLLRNGEQLLVAVVLPAAVLFVLVSAHSIPLGDGRRVDLAVPGVLALCVISSAFTGQAIATGFDRRYGVLRLLGVTPLGRTGLLAARSLAVLSVIVVQFAVIAALGLGLGWDPALVGLPAALVSTLLGTWAFAALGLLLGGTVRAEGVLALANLLWVAMLGLGGVVVAGSQLPDRFAPLVAALPSAALGDSLRAALVSGQASPRDWLVLAAWGLGATLLGRRFFRWGD